MDLSRASPCHAIEQTQVSTSIPPTDIISTNKREREKERCGCWERLRETERDRLTYRERANKLSVSVCVLGRDRRTLMGLAPQLGKHQQPTIDQAGSRNREAD